MGSAYWDMIITMYTINGAFLVGASYSPAQFKALIGFNTWGLNFGHGIVAFIHAFFDVNPSTAAAWTPDDPTPGNPYGWLKGTNYDKLLVAVPLWFTLGTVNLIMANKCFGSALLPWQVRKSVNGDRDVAPSVD